MRICFRECPSLSVTDEYAVENTLANLRRYFSFNITKQIKAVFQSQREQHHFKNTFTPLNDISFH